MSSSESDVVDCSDSNSQESVESESQLSQLSQPRRGAKPKDKVWSNFTEVYLEKNGRQMKVQRCIKCKVNVSAKADRLRNHLEKCKKEIGDAEVSTEKSSKNIESDSSRQTLPPLAQSKISNFLKKTVTTKKEKEDLDLKTAQFWYSANLAFNSANLKTWKDLCSSMRPGYEPPSEHMLQGNLLDKTYDDLRRKMVDDLKGKQGILIQDGWSDIHNSPTLTHTVVCNGDAYLINSIECEEEKKTADYCAARFEEAMVELAKMEFEVIGGSTDNCSTMTRMRDVLQSKHEHLLLYGCSAHMLNLLCEDITPKQVVAKINEVSKYFRDHHEPSALLAKKGGLKPQLPATTRWISHQQCLDVFIKNRTKYIEIAQIAGVCHNNIIDTVNSLAIYKNAKDLLEQMNEISLELLKLQSDSSNVADAMHSWLKLLKSRTLSGHIKSVEKRMKVAVAPFFGVAYLMHPKYQGELMNAKQRDEALEYLLKIDPSFVRLAQSFLAKDTTTFPKVSMNENVLKESQPITWWFNVKHRDEISDAFVNFIITLYRCPASTASVERVFSTYGFVQTKKRNRLSQEKVMKLSFCFRALRKDDCKINRKRKLISESEED